MAVTDWERQIAAEELLNLQYHLTTLAAQVQTDLSGLAESSTVAEIHTAKTAYDVTRNAFANYGNIRIPAPVNTTIFTKIAAEAAA